MIDRNTVPPGSASAHDLPAWGRPDSPLARRLDARARRRAAQPAPVAELNIDVPLPVEGGAR